MRFVLVTYALCVAACGGSDSRPAQDPSANGSTMNQSSGATAGGGAADPSPAVHSGPNTSTVSATAPPSTLSTPAGTANAGAPPPRADAAVVNDPGAADQTKNADNTKINDRDRHDSMTPMSQGNSGSELKISAAIRRGVMGDKSLSFTAKNVKIITVGSKVTLRGPVKTDQEKATIEALAKQTAGVAEVDDQLEVKK